jgi:hypothetical protein
MTLDASEAFYAKLGFMREASHENYLILSDGKGWNIHLTIAVEGGLKPWEMYEFAFSDPDEKLVRVGWPTSRG